jgi:predicted acylesterase/phospholipase RssA
MKLSKQVFNLDKVKFDAVPVGENHCRFDEKELEKALKHVIHKAIGDEDAPLADPNDRTPDCCPVFVVATMAQNATDSPKLFRSYGKSKEKCRIWEAARATSAAPTYFPPIHITRPRPGCWYTDGGLKRNNPSEVALEEARELWKTSRQFLIVSIGTGMQEPADFIESPEVQEDGDGTTSSESEGPSEEGPKQRMRSSIGQRVKAATSRAVSSVGSGGKALASNLPFAENVAQFTRIPGGITTLERFAHELVTLSTNSEDTHNRMSKSANSHDHRLRFPYYRFNVPLGMDKIDLEEWKSQVKMAALTWGYLSRDEVKRDVEKCAKCLFDPSGFESI